MSRWRYVKGDLGRYDVCLPPNTCMCAASRYRALLHSAGLFYTVQGSFTQYRALLQMSGLIYTVQGSFTQ